VRRWRFIIISFRRIKPRSISIERTKVFLFLIPAAALISIFLVYPILRCGYYSTFDWNGMGPAQDFIGMGNFLKLFTDKVFLKAVVNSFIIVALSLSIQLPLAMFLALMVGRKIRGRGFYRTVFFMPYVLSETITAVMWRILYNPEPSRGFINAVFQAIGLKTQAWLGDTSLVLFSIFMVLTWKYIGFHMLLYITGLQNIPRDVEEAALIDGVTKRQMITQITLPLIMGTVRTSIYLSVLGSLQVFAIVWIMTKGGPVNASEILSTYMYRFSFVRFQLGYGAAIAIMMLIIALVFSVTYRSFVRKTEYIA
jgi:raffinose/stachyose/melibiose transport system permease protein